MEQDVEAGYRTTCSTCLSSDRDLFDLCSLPQIYEVFRLLMYDFAGEKLGETITQWEHLLCWECLAMMKRFLKFKWQVHNAQEHLRVLSMSRTQECMDHTYMSQSLSSLESATKLGYDKIFFDFSCTPEEEQYILPITTTQDVKNEQFDVTQVVSDNMTLSIGNQILEVPELVLEGSQPTVSNIVVGETIYSPMTTDGTFVKGEMPHLTIEPLTINDTKTAVISQKPKGRPKTCGYITEYMTDDAMMQCREEARKKIQYAGAVFKCELCILGFHNQQQVEGHFVEAHRERPGHVTCKVCYTYVPESKLAAHTDQHYIRYYCKLCGQSETSLKFIQSHVTTHLIKQPNSAVIKIGDVTPKPSKSKKKKENKEEPPPAKPGDLRKLLSKTTIEGYQCLECDMFFKSSRARKTHVARFHREGLQCDHCKKRFVNKSTLATHLKLHEGPLPREECPICHKMVRSIQLKYHIQRHENKSRYVCGECDKIFSHLATYQAHLKYARAHATEQVFKFPCPMCNKGYPTKESMQDHFNYQHLGKTSHKCPICQKPIASRANVDKHMMRVHGDKKEKPRNHCCRVCGKRFTDKKALVQHEVIHSGERPLSCDICTQTFKQKASLYTHKKRVHKVFPAKRLVEYMDAKN